MIAHNQQSCLVEITLLVNEPTTDSSSLLDNVPKKCGIQKRMTLLNICYKTKSQQTLINIYQWTLHTFILFRLDIPQSVVTYTYTSNIFFLELSGFGYAPTHWDPIFYCFVFCWKQPNKYFGPPITVSSISANLVWHSRNKN